MTTGTVTKMTACCPHRKAGACGECFGVMVQQALMRKARVAVWKRRALAWRRAAKGWRWLAHEISAQPAVIVRTSRPRFQTSPVAAPKEGART